ncbi:hypothetical protein AVEN_63895-1 [Araneus ventricosus]|uniref:Uncharacterized protein n=1 Tax=Araneus ventricosus TaxID=182803 RepID=A0A4Y2GBS0_ARAVE|nr:hypothetical protein AVEN_63895-1 [Araneus ventricosus]
MFFKLEEVQKIGLVGHSWLGCSASFGACFARQFQFSAHPFRWVIHRSSMQTTQSVTSVSQGFCAYPSSHLESGTPIQLSRARFTPPPPFCGFRFWERGSQPLAYDCISLLWPSAVVMTHGPDLPT